MRMGALLERRRIDGLRVVHVPFGYYPDLVGGTEVYVENLVASLATRGLASTVVAPGTAVARYEHNCIPVSRFLAPPVTDLQAFYGEGDSECAANFLGIVDDELPDIVHVHALTPAISRLAIRGVQERGIPVVFTYHTPTATCQRGTLLRWGRTPCDGILDVSRCTSCTLHANGLPAGVAALVAHAPSSARTYARDHDLAGGPWTALRMRDLISAHHDAICGILDSVDHVVVPCLWARNLLFRNGVAMEKMTLSRHGLASQPVRRAASHKESFPLQLAFFGRLDPIKGIDLVIQAVRNLPEAPVRLAIYGTAQGFSGDRYLHRLRQFAGDDPRIEFRSPLPPGDVVAAMRAFHAVVVPSQGLETGPLVVLEAFEAGVPVLGSGLGGIAEIVTHGKDGLLIEHDSVAAWGNSIKGLAEAPQRLQALHRGVTRPRSMDAVAQDMVQVYDCALRRESVQSHVPTSASAPAGLLKD